MSLDVRLVLPSGLHTSPRSPTTTVLPPWRWLASLPLFDDSDVFYRVPFVVWEGNITHNLVHMAREAAIYTTIWRPEKLGLRWAWQLRMVLEPKLYNLQFNPMLFRPHEAKNGWGTYENLVTFAL